MREEMLTVDEVATWLKMNPQTIRNWIDRGELKAFHVGRLVRIRTSELDRFMAEGGDVPQPEAPPEKAEQNILESTDDLSIAITEILRTAAASGAPDVAAALRTLSAATAGLADDAERASDREGDA